MAKFCGRRNVYPSGVEQSFHLAGLRRRRSHPGQWVSSKPVVSPSRNERPRPAAERDCLRASSALTHAPGAGTHSAQIWQSGVIDLDRASNGGAVIMMRRQFHFHSFAAALLAVALLRLVPLLLGADVRAQTAAQNTPQALKATYDQAMQAKDWPAAIAAAQQLVGANATSANLLLLGNAQLYAGALGGGIARHL